MAEYLIQDTTLDDIADAINAKTGGSSAMTPAQMVTEIGNISGGGLSTLYTAGTISFWQGQQGVIKPDVEVDMPSLSEISIDSNRSASRVMFS